MAFSSAFKTTAIDPWGEAIRTRVYVRLNDGAGGTPSTLVTVTTYQSVLSLNPISRKRELKFGTVQGQSWMVKVTNVDLDMLKYDFKGCWAAIYGGFPTDNEWSCFAQGKIAKVTASIDGTVTLEVHDSVMDLLNFALPRDISFQSTGWISGMKNVTKASGSGNYSSSQALTLNTPAAADDETFIIEFTASNAYKVILEGGDETQIGLVSANKTIYNDAGDASIITIPAAGWGSGTFSVGDRFEFYTARPRTTSELTPVYMVEHLIDDIAGVGAYDVLNGAAYSSARLDTTSWATIAASHASKIINGEWSKGTKLSRLIQDALKIVHGSIFPTATGQIGLWVLSPSTSVAIELNGNPNSPPVDIVDASFSENNNDAVSEVVFTYLALDGESAVYTATDSATSLLEPRSVKVDIGWRVDGPAVKDACDKYLNRFKGGLTEYELLATLAGCVADIGDRIAITEGELILESEITDVTEIAIDLLGQKVKLKGHTDPVILEDYFILDDGTGTAGSLLDNTTEVLW